jgi:hypothetical protein
MRIRVAPGARRIGEMILPGSGRRRSRYMGGVRIAHVGQRFVAVRAQYSRVSVDENEFRLRMARQVERGRPEGLLGMAEFAAILVRRQAEFAAMRVGVAIHAGRLA